MMASRLAGKLLDPSTRSLLQLNAYFWGKNWASSGDLARVESRESLQNVGRARRSSSKIGLTPIIGRKI